MVPEAWASNIKYIDQYMARKELTKTGSLSRFTGDMMTCTLREIGTVN